MKITLKCHGYRRSLRRLFHFYPYYCAIIMLLGFCDLAYAASQEVLNIYAWTGEIPDYIVQQFTKETGILVNISTYENNEMMYTKLRMLQTPSYDIIMPSSYFVDRMRKQNLLMRIDTKQLANWHHLDPTLLHLSYDPESAYSIPYIWGVTGIFINTRFYSTQHIKGWSDLWNKQYHNQLMLLDDMREVFNIGFLSLGYSINTKNSSKIHQVFLQLKALIKNVKVFSSDTVISLMIDEDATIGMAWNGDAFKASQENPHIKFIFPKEGFAMWTDNFAIPKNAPHLHAAYQFLNFILRPDIAKSIALFTNYPIANLSGRKQLPQNIQDSKIMYPSLQELKNAHFQKDLSDSTLEQYEKYWEILKMSDE